MALLRNKVLFITTSPRTPAKMIPEIHLLSENFGGQEWNNETQKAFMDVLRNEDFFNGKGQNDPALSARDRITRAPKSLGFIKLHPSIELTPAGKRLITAKRTDEIFLRQLMKFQLPSPYHKMTNYAADYWVKPYLELLRLVRTLGTLKFDELQLFGMQLVNWHEFNNVIEKIKKFREDKLHNKGSYRKFKQEYLESELKRLYADRIKSGDTKTRESEDKSVKKFLKTQGSNIRDYADALFRYLRATGLVNVSHVGKSLSIIPERQEEVDYILRNLPRDPIFVNDETEYVSYLGDATLPHLLTDDRELLIGKIRKEFPSNAFDEAMSIEQLKDLLSNYRDNQKDTIIKNQIIDIKSHKHYDDIQQTFERIKKDDVYDAPLMLEWNTWRAMTMLDGGNIKANLKFDDFGKPLSTAQGNMPDIICDYGQFYVSVEVTTASGQRQYEMEGEPVSRHLGKLKKATGKPCYCLFIAPTINDASIAHFFMLQRIEVSYYGGRSNIIPLPLKVFQKMLEDSFASSYIPEPKHVEAFFKTAEEIAKKSRNEEEWYKRISTKAEKWL